MKLSLERTIVGTVAALIPGVIMTHCIAALLRIYFAPDAASAVLALAMGAVIVTIVPAACFAVTHSPKLCRAVSWFIGPLVGLPLVGHFSGSWVPCVGIIVVSPFVFELFARVAGRLPESVDGVLQRRPLRSILWGLIALLAVVQTVRLSSWISDPATDWWLCTRDPYYAQHMCLNAYIHGADLNRQGVENIYGFEYYPGLNPEATPQTTVTNLSPDDPYQYPPQFLLLPRFALALTNDFCVIKIAWFALQTMAFLVLFWRLASFVGGIRGRCALLLIPLVWVSFPILSNFQYGQFHLASVALAVIGMMLFATERPILGGAALALGILSKLTPGILLVYLLARKQYRELAWTLGFCVTYTVAALFLVGTEPFVAFFNYHLPRLQDGSAFAFATAWPEYENLIIAGNQSPYGVILKLAALGVDGMTSAVAGIVHNAYALVIVALGIFAGRKCSEKTAPPLVWLALLNLAALVSKGAWGDYVPLGSVWMLSFLAVEFAESMRWRAFIAACWVFIGISLGVMPAPVLEDAPLVMISLSLVGFVMIVTLNTWIIFRQASRVANSKS